MATRQFRRANSNSKKCAELAVAVPQVIAHRLTRAVLAGPALSEQDRKEFQRMVSEKQAAFSQAYWEMGLQMFRVNLQLNTLLFRALFAPFSLTLPSVASAMAQTQEAMGTLLGKGLAPIHRAATLNARRLSRIPVR
jgi:hypothetical protein